MKKSKPILWAVGFLYILSFPAKAQDTISYSCDCSRPDYHAPAGVMINHTHAKKEWMISYRYMNMWMKDNMQGNRRIGNEEIYKRYLMGTESMSMQMHMLMLMYGISSRITIMGMTNFIVNRMHMSMIEAGTQGGHTAHQSSGGHSHDHGSLMHNNGLGDTKGYILYSLIKDGKNELLLSGGINIPTGSVSKYGTSLMGGTQKYTYSMQLGTGSWGVLPGVTYTISGGKLSFGMQAISDFKINRNKSGYRLGNEFTSNTWLAKSWNAWISNSLRFNTTYIGKTTGFDAELSPLRTTDPDADLNNSGIFITTINIGLNIAIPNGFFSRNRLGVEFGVPLYQYVNGIQPRRQAILSAAWQFNF